MFGYTNFGGDQYFHFHHFKTNYCAIVLNSPKTNLTSSSHFLSRNCNQTINPTFLLPLIPQYGSLLIAPFLIANRHLKLKQWRLIKIVNKQYSDDGRPDLTTLMYHRADAGSGRIDQFCYDWEVVEKMRWADKE